MAYRNGTYVAFHAGGTSDPTASDIRYYNIMKGWCEHKHIDFKLINSHEKTGAVRDTSSRATLRASLSERLRNSRQMVLILTETTKNDTDWVPFEIEYAVDVCKMPIIAVYPGYDWILQPAALFALWPQALSTRIQSGNARVIHIPFKIQTLTDAIERFDVFNTEYPTTGYGYYNEEAHVKWGLKPAR